MKDLKTTNSLLLIIVIPLIFYLLKILSFIFIPLILSMFIALLFLPIMRWFKRKKFPKWLSILIIILLIIGSIKAGGELIRLSSKEILSADNTFFKKAEIKINDVILSVEHFFGLERVEGEKVLNHYINQDNIMVNVKYALTFIRSTLSIVLMTAFFVILLLAGSVDFQKLLNQTLIKAKYSSMKAFFKIEKDIIKFVKVKFIISLFTGIGFSLSCVIFGVSFPIFWGLFAFVVNFIQMIGSVISIILLALFAFVELDPTGTLLLFIMVIIAIQVLMGSVLEPIFMGKTFSVNVVTILIMLMLWGYIWGIPGLIISVPMTVIIKIILEQFPKTKIIADFLSGKDPKVPLLINKNLNDKNN